MGLVKLTLLSQDSLDEISRAERGVATRGYGETLVPSSWFELQLFLSFTNKTISP